jgi:hypothetical protein
MQGPSRVPVAGVASLAPILSRCPAASIADAMEVMTAIDALLPDGDGVKWFNRLYLEVTRSVRDSVAGAITFADPSFMSNLDVIFANLYFDAAAAADRDPSAAPPAWRPLFLSRNRPGLTRLQCALAGMNAHINRDLPDAIDRCFRTMGGDPAPRGPRHDDYERVNDLLDHVEARVKVEYAVGLIGAIDQVARPCDDIAAMWSIRAARDAAWTHAQVLWTLDGQPDLRTAFFGSLDRFTGFAGRGLLFPVA